MKRCRVQFKFGSTTLSVNIVDAAALLAAVSARLKARQGFAGFDCLPDQVAHVIEKCKGDRGMPENVRNLL